VRPAPYSFSFEPLFLVLAAAALVLYVRAARRDPPGRGRATLFGAGLLLVAVSLNSPLETLAANYLVMMHLAQNALTADWAPPALILGLTPAMRVAVAGRGARLLERSTRPGAALVIWLAAWYGTHLALFYDYSLRHDWALNLQHAILIAAGLVFWWPVLGSQRLSTLGTLAYLGAAFATSLFLGLAFIFSSHPFYDFYAEAPRLWGLSAVKDQNFGGIVMNAEQTIVFLGALSYYLLRLLNEEDEAQRAREAYSR
jgi:putative membrane protein